MSKIICSGALFYSLSTKKFLLLHRTKSRQNKVWGLVGGKNEDCETPWEGLKREITEEIGDNHDIIKVIPLETFVSNDEVFNFHTYLCITEKEFIPTLNDEHNGYAWTSLNSWPRPLHQGLSKTLKNKDNQNKLNTILELLDVIDITN